MTAFFRLYIDAYRGLSTAAWMLSLVMLINRIGSMTLPFLGIYMTNALDFNLKEVGIILACFGCGAVTGSWLGGWLTDKYGNFIVQVLALLLSAPLFLILPLFTTVTSLGMAIYILSTVSESFRPANSVSVARYAKRENITRAFSLNRTAINLGFSIGPAVAGLLATISYNWIFYGNAIGTVLAAVVFILYFRNKEGNTPRQTSDADIPGTDRSPYTDWPFVFFAFLNCLYAICFFQILNTIPLFFQQDHALSEKQIGMLLGFSGFVVVIFEMILVQISEKRLTYAFSIALGIGLCAMSFGLLAAANSLVTLYLAIFLLSVSEILALPFMASVAVKRASFKSQGAYMGLSSLAFSAAHIFSPVVGTHIAETAGFDALWIGTAVLLLLVSIVIYRVVKIL